MDKLNSIINEVGISYYKTDELMRYHTALAQGGLAKLFFITLKISELIKIIKICRQYNMPFLIFGTGSRMPISNDGFDGVVIKNRANKMEVISVKGKVTKTGIDVEQAIVEVESGTSFRQLAEFLDKQGLVNDLFLRNVGSIGGSLATDQSFKSVVESLKVLDTHNDIEKIDLNSLNLSQHVILSVVIRVQAKGK